MKKAISKIASVFLIVSLLSPTAASAGSAEIVACERLKSVASRCDPNNYVRFEIQGDTLKMEGVLTENGTGTAYFFVEKPDGEDDATVAVEASTNYFRVLEFKPGEKFTTEIDLGQFTELQRIYVTFQPRDSTSNRFSIIATYSGGSWGFPLGTSDYYVDNREEYAKPVNTDTTWVDVGKDYVDLSNSIVAGAGNDYEKVKAIYQWVTSNIYYDAYKLVYGSRNSADAGNILEIKRGLCGDYSMLMQKLVQAQGIPCILVTGTVTGIGHAWNEAYADNRWVILDATAGSGNVYTGKEYRAGETFMTYFDMTIEALSKRQWIDSRSGAEESAYGNRPGGRDKAIRSVVPVKAGDLPVQTEAYNIGGSNYFKLRDIARLLDGTEKEFAVGWDPASNSISLASGAEYVPEGGGLSVSGSLANLKVTPATASLYANGTKIGLTAYKIGENNYFKLRDIAKAMDFGVTWDGGTGTVGIDASSGYTG